MQIWCHTPRWIAKKTSNLNQIWVKQNSAIFPQLNRTTKPDMASPEISLWHLNKKRSKIAHHTLEILEIQLLSRTKANYRSLARTKQNPATFHQKLQETEPTWKIVVFFSCNVNHSIIFFLYFIIFFFYVSWFNLLQHSKLPPPFPFFSLKWNLLQKKKTFD
jgi:hypothetical protein